MFKTGNETVDAIGQINLEGNVIPHKWFDHIKFENGKPDLTAIIILSEIVYWHRPFYVKDETTGSLIGLKKRFKADLLQRSYDSFANQFGITKRQATEAIRRLEIDGYVKRHFRTIDANGTKLNNVLFIQLLHENLIPMTFNSDTYHIKTSEVSLLNDIAITSKRQTNTEITTENTTNIKNIDVVREVITYLNNKAGKDFKYTTDKTKAMIHARLSDGYTVEQIKQVIDIKTAHWLNDPYWERYLRPNTLFAPSNFENYLNEVPTKTKQSKQQAHYQPPQLNFSEGENIG